uniref:Monovalent Cation:Proton Antiporter2 (CPA2) family putative n=1 Tax=Albugo laibachii Nc14 TaxID=890382 RepID=F0W3X8_9STRA|nr:monovalent Cation:Proton Antiporter2 (CPA2) family putative [Albugo laibachii Nc14]|eukprot:CCA15773.1 monovalent Cation:Proton Antiporter2 (CPA2) family putative [Albugo laibachii Nc14]
MQCFSIFFCCAILWSLSGNNEAFAEVIEPESSSLEVHTVEKRQISVVSSKTIPLRSTANIDQTVDVIPAPNEHHLGVSDKESNNVISHVETQLHILQKLETNVAKGIEKMQNEVLLQVQDQQSLHEATKLFRELHIVKNNLQKLATGLNETLFDMQVVEKNSEKKAQHLKSVLDHQRQEEEDAFIKENGIKVIDYETGQLQNITGLSSTKSKKLQDVDPAVLHYDFELLGQIAVLLGVSAIGGICASYFNIPPHTGYLLGGVLVGPSCLGIVHNYKEVETISLFGSIFLLFGHGTGYILQRPQVLRTYLVGSSAYVIATVASVAIFMSFVGWTESILQGIIIGVAVCFTTTAPIYERLRVNEVHDTSFGKTITSIIALQDALMSFALGAPEWFSAKSLSLVSMAALRSIFSFGIVVSVAYVLHTRILPPLVQFLVDMEHLHHSPLVLLGVVSVCLFMALLTEFIGLSLECGAFLAGLAFMENTTRSTNMQRAIASIRVIENLFGSMFFACVGMILNPSFLIRNACEIISLVFMIVGIKTVCTTAVMRFYKVSIRKALIAGVSLCQIGELSLIFMIKAHSSHLVTRRVYLLFIAAIAVFLGCSSLFERQIVLARKKKMFRSPATKTPGLKVPVLPRESIGPCIVTADKGIPTPVNNRDDTVESRRPKGCVNASTVRHQNTCH